MGEPTNSSGVTAPPSPTAIERKAPPPVPHTPINRYLVVVIYCLYCLISGPAYFNWTPIADSLFSHGAFKWTCSEKELAEPKPFSYSPSCNAQEIAVNALFSVASSSHFFCSFLGGFLLDVLGPKFTGMIGISVMALGWVLMAVASQTFNCYTMAAVLIGMSVDTAFFPCLSAANLFPDKGSTVIAFLGCFRSLAFVVPLAIRAAVVQNKVATAPQAILVYAGVFLTLCFMVVAFLMPRASYEKQGEQLAASADGKAPLTTKATRDGEDVAPSRTMSKRESLRRAASAKLKSFAAECCSLPFLPLLPLFSFILTNLIFFVPSALHLLPKAYEANQIIQTFSFLPCPMLGYLADKVGILPVMHLCNLCGLLAYVCVVIPSIPAYTGLQFLASILIAVQMSFMMSQLYCYISIIFSQENLGKLVGLVCAVAGLFSLISGPMRSYALAKGYMNMCIVAICLGTCNAAIITFLHILYIRRRRRRAKTAALDAEALGVSRV